MARGVPVATSGRASLAEVAGDAALLFDPHDDGDIARAIERLLSDRGLAAELAARGRTRIGELTWERTARLTLDTYRRAIEQATAA